MEFDFINRLPSQASPNFNCYQWTIIQELDFKERSLIQIKLDKRRNVCQSSREYTWQNYFWLHFLVMILSLVSLIGHWQYIVAVSHTYEKLRSKFEHRKMHKSMYDGLNKDKAKIQKRNKEYKRCISNMSGSQHLAANHVAEEEIEGSLFEINMSKYIHQNVLETLAIKSLAGFSHLGI